MKTLFFQKTLAQIPQQVRWFLIKALIMFIVWKLLYNLVLFPFRTPDKQLTDITAKTTGFLYTHLINSNTQVELKDTYKDGIVSTVVYLNSKHSLGIADGCNGLELYVLYVALLFCLPTTLKRQLLFVLIGIVSIFILNGFRCLGLTWVYTMQYKYFSFVHHYLFKIIIYAFIFFLWTLYAKRLKYAA